MRGRADYRIKSYKKEVTDAEYIAIHPFAGNLYAGGEWEDFLVGMLEEVKNIDFYKGIELPVIFQKENIAKVRRIAREKSYQVTEWASPDIIKRGYNLSSTDRELRVQSVGYAVELMKIAAEAGTAIVGLHQEMIRVI